MAEGNVGNITARANVCSCNCNREGFCNCDCFQTNEIGVNNGRKLTSTEPITNNNSNNNTNNGRNLF